MQLKYFSREEFEQKLSQDLGLTKTDEGVPTARAWKTRGGKLLMIPEPPENNRYPDYFLDRILHQLRAMGEAPRTQSTAAPGAGKAVPASTRPAK